MKTIIPPQKAVLQILGSARSQCGVWRLCHYCHALPVEDGVLLYHLLTRELLLLSPSEWDAALTLPELRERWFVVPDDTKEQEHTDLVRWALRAMKQRVPVTNFTILPTTDCNARCFYCYEAGRPRRMMRPETAHRAAAYIAEQSSGKPVRLSWFGGEPLMNPDAIDTICASLAAAGIPYASSMTTNGYLFDPALVKKAKDHWKLRFVQITLDGTEQMYNRTKAYVNTEGSAFQTVMQNIRLLLAADVHVTIRLNVGTHNAQDMLQLAETLAHELSGMGSLSVYAHLLFGTASFDVTSQTEEQRANAALEQLTERLTALGLKRSEELHRELPLTQCMADSGCSRVILPDGRMTVCEHHTEDEIIGQITSPQLDERLIKTWTEKEAPIAACAACALYPECIRLKKCDALEKCTDATRHAALRSREHSMLNEYQRFLTREKAQSPGC